MLRFNTKVFHLTFNIFKRQGHWRYWSKSAAFKTRFPIGILEEFRWNMLYNISSAEKYKLFLLLDKADDRRIPIPSNIWSEKQLTFCRKYMLD